MLICYLDQGNDHPGLHAIVKDANRFLLSNNSIVQKAPLQVYASTLVFSPRKSQIREENLSYYSVWFKYGPAVEDHWGNELQVLEQDDCVTGVALSFGGKFIASSVGIIIALWNPTTGILQSTLQGHREQIRSVVFSRNGQLASCSINGRVLVWEPLTDIIRRKLKVPNHLVDKYRRICMALAPDGTFVISMSTNSVYMRKSGRTTSLATIKLISGIKGMTFCSWGELALVCGPKALGGKGELLHYDLRTKAERHISIPKFYHASFSSDDHVAITIANNNIRVYNLIIGSHLNLRRSKDHSYLLLRTFSFNDKGMLLGLEDWFKDPRGDLFS